MMWKGIPELNSKESKVFLVEINLRFWKKTSMQKLSMSGIKFEQ